MHRYRSLLYVMVFLFIGGCGRGDPPLHKLSDSSNLPYEVFLQTFKDGAYADQPFKLFTKGKSDDDKLPMEVLFASQCKNVQVVPTRQYLYIFYEYISLDSFTSIAYEPDPTPFLCGLSHPVCKEIFEKAKKEGASAYQACTQL